MITQCLAHTPMLTSLHIHRVATDMVLNYLTLQHGYGDRSVSWLVPKLKTLRLSGKLYFQARTVTKLVHSRWQSDMSPSSLSSSALSSRLTSTSDCSTIDAIPVITTMIPVDDGRPRTLRCVDILPPRQDKFDMEEKNELLALNLQGFEVNIRPLDRPGFLSHNSMLGFDGKGALQVGRG